MSTDTAFLALMLDAPLMSFGHASRFQRRTTALQPTRSALTGMICAAAGADKGSAAEAAWLERLDPRHLRLGQWGQPSLFGFILTYKCHHAAPSSTLGGAIAARIASAVRCRRASATS
jgi:CRISPR-associated Cas5-like protein